MQHTINNPEAYIASAAAALKAAGVNVTDHWTQTDAGRSDDGEPIWEGCIEIDDCEDALAWNERDGWQHLTGPATSYGPYNNVVDMSSPIDAPVADVVVEARTRLGFDADAQVLIDQVLAVLRGMPDITVRSACDGAVGGFDGWVVGFSAEDDIKGWVGRLHTPADGQMPWQVAAAHRDEIGLHARHDAYPASLAQVPAAVARVVNRVAADLAVT